MSFERHWIVQSIESADLVPASLEGRQSSIVHRYSLRSFVTLLSLDSWSFTGGLAAGIRFQTVLGIRSTFLLRLIIALVSFPWASVGFYVVVPHRGLVRYLLRAFIHTCVSF